MQANIGIIGLGTVGAATAELIVKNSQYYQEKLGKLLRITSIFDIDKRTMRRIGIDIRGLNPVFMPDDSLKIIDNKSVEIVVEAIGGIDKSRDLVTRALKNGKIVVTPNKDLIATHGRELLEIAKENGTRIYYGASVAGAIPILDNIEKNILSDKIYKLFGIMNGTCNFILTQMEVEGWSFDRALSEAQRLGYAEQDSANDIELKDTLYKLVILIKQVFGGFVDMDNIHTEGISKISAKDQQYAKDLKYSIKAVGYVEKTKEGLLSCFAEPVFVDKNNEASCINGVENCITLYTENIGEDQTLSFVGPGAGGEATATAVVTDIINAVGEKGKEIVESKSEDLSLEKYENIKTRFYIRFDLANKSGSLNKITGVLAKYGLNIARIYQPEGNDIGEISFILDKVDLNTINSVLADIKADNLALGDAVVYRVI